MTTVIIGPDGLEADAVVPQCLDNQYVSDGIFAKMTAEGLDYRDKEVAGLRENEFKTEFIRSLVYSSQVVIQRAFLKNSDFLYKNYLPEDGKNLMSFAQLIRDKAVVPFLFKESSLRNKLELDVSKEGDRATNALLDEVGTEVTCARLSVDNVANERIAASMATDFATRLTRLQHMNSTQRSAMASELFSERQRLDEEGAFSQFSAAVTQLAKYSFEKAGQLLEESDSVLTRQHVYRDNFIVGGKDDENVVLGRFKRPGRDNPFLLELKKYVDLVYNTNLPDHLKRYTFTPVNMPSRMAMQDPPGEAFSHEQVSGVLSDDDALEFARRAFMAHSQKAMSLPLLRDLTVADVLEIRALPEWAPFKETQARILSDPLDCLDQFEQFQRNFDEFQRALSDWYNCKYQRARTEERYCSYVSLALSLAGKLIVAGSDLGAYEKALSSFAGDLAVSSIPKKVKGYAAKLMIGVYDMGKRKLDVDRTYTIELMQTNAELVREDVIALLESISRKAGAHLPGLSAQLADQGAL